MHIRYGLIAGILFISACTVSTGNNMLEGDFHPPLVYQPWETQHFTLASGTQACSLSSGANGITVVVSGHGDVAAKSNKLIKPGNTFTVSTQGSVFETSDEFFPEKTARLIAERFVQGGNAYLEWREFSGPTQSPVRVQNVARLDNFKAQWMDCKKFVGLEK